MMPIHLYSTLTKKKELLKPFRPPEVSMYVCGPTVYNFLHVGNFRGPVVFNLLRSWLEYRGYKPKYALNFTDVDDKILNRAIEEKVHPSVVSEKYIEEYKKDFKSLGLRSHELNPKVTESMSDIIAFIEKLIANKKAYVVDGDVWYSVRSFDDYGKLSGRKVDDLLSGARVEVNESKKDPLDFALWKSAKPNEQSWPSPWGQGRPGWHIECSAMACRHLGEQIDIHGGGSDLMFPHHENEIAQSEGALGKDFVQIWIHWNMLNFGGQKMSKSLGNFTTMRDFLEKHHPEVYKWMILSVHYRHTADFSMEALDRAIGSLAKIYSTLAVAQEILKSQNIDFKAVDYSNEAKIQGFKETQFKVDSGAQEFEKFLQSSWSEIEKALDDDLGTPELVAQLFEVIRKFNGMVKRGVKATPAIISQSYLLNKFVLKIGYMMSLFQQDASRFLLELDDILLTKKNIKRESVDRLIEQRIDARKNKNFQESDRIRDELLGMGISVADTPQGTYWEVTK